MSFIELAKRRYSVRSYSDRPVEKEQLLQVLEAGRIAPSAVNYQPWHFIVVDDEELKSRLAEAYPREWFKKAPVLIVVCGDHSQSWKRKDTKDHCDIDAAIAIDHMTLAATDLGIGTCWVCAFDAVRAHHILDLPDYFEVIALLPMGYPADEPDVQRHQDKRKAFDDIVSWNGYVY